MSRLLGLIWDVMIMGLFSRLDTTLIIDPLTTLTHAVMGPSYLLH